MSSSDRVLTVALRPPASGADEPLLRPSPTSASSTSLLHAALASMRDLTVVLFDVELRVLEIHGGGLAHRGYDRTRIIDRRLPEIVRGEIWQRIEPLCEAALAGGTASVDHPSRDGVTIYESTADPVLEDGRIIGGMIVARDVSAARRADDALALFEASFAEAPIGMSLVGLDGRFLRVNPALCRTLHRTERELLSCDFQGITHPDDLDGGVAQMHEMLAGDRDGYAVDKRYLSPSGGVIEVRVSVSLVRDAAGRPAHFVTQVVDLSPLEAARRELVAVNARLQAILDHTPMAVYMRDLEERWTLLNPETTRIFGRPEAELLGRPLGETHPDQAAVWTAHDRSVLASGQPDSFDTVIEDARTGVPHHFWTLRFPVREPDGTVVGVGGVSLDVTERERVTRELAAAHELFHTAFAHAPIGMLISRAPGPSGSDVVQCNEAFAAMLGYRPEDLIGRSANLVVHPDDQPERERFIAGMRGGTPRSEELRFVHRDGHDVAALVAPSLSISADGEELFVVQALDISERKRYESRLRHLADHDALTGLFNRRRFEEELGRAVTQVRDSSRPAALVMLDLDGFKDVNDVFGHSTGDQLIVRIGAALRRALREEDVLARIGGDEFAAILADTTPGEARAVSAKLVEAVRSHGRGVTDGSAAEVTASVGLTTLPTGLRDDGEALLVEADIALYQAKDAGKDRVAVYERADRRREQLTRHSDWVGRLRRALKQERFLLHAQPVVPLLTPAPDGAEHYELLLRLRGDGGSLVPPATFLPHAERHGLIGDIDRWVLREAVQTLHHAHVAGRALHLAVNLSARTMQDPTIADHLAALLAEHPVPPGVLMIEVTETAAITNVARAGELARQLRALGCKLALDDFGAGFASFYYLKHLDFDVLKIDGAFIDQLPRSATDQLVVRAVVDVARGLGAYVIAERVQDEEAVELLREFGVDYGQGYHLGRPAPLPD